MGDRPQSPIPKSPIPNPQSPKKLYFLIEIILLIILFKNKK